jgi:hypothetical protein
MGAPHPMAHGLARRDAWRVRRRVRQAWRIRCVGPRHGSCALRVTAVTPRHAVPRTWDVGVVEGHQHGRQPLHALLVQLPPLFGRGDGSDGRHPHPPGPRRRTHLHRGCCCRHAAAVRGPCVRRCGAAGAGAAMRAAAAVVGAAPAAAASAAAAGGGAATDGAAVAADCGGGGLVASGARRCCRRRVCGAGLRGARVGAGGLRCCARGCRVAAGAGAVTIIHAERAHGFQQGQAGLALGYQVLQRGQARQQADPLPLQRRTPGGGVGAWGWGWVAWGGVGWGWVCVHWGRGGAIGTVSMARGSRCHAQSRHGRGPPGARAQRQAAGFVGAAKAGRLGSPCRAEQLPPRTSSTATSERLPCTSLSMRDTCARAVAPGGGQPNTAGHAARGRIEPHASQQAAAGAARTSCCWCFRLARRLALRSMVTGPRLLLRAAGVAGAGFVRAPAACCG